MKKVVFVDSQSLDSFHEIFNLSFLLIMSQSFDQVEYLASRSSIENLKSKILRDNHKSIDNVIFKEIFVIRGEGSHYIFLRKLLGAFTILKSIIKYRNKDRVILGSLNEFSTIYINSIAKLFKVSIQIVCHGELEYVIKKNIPFLKPLKLYKRLISNFLSKPISERISLLLLGKSIQENLLYLYPKQIERLSYINHPYFFKKQTAAATIESNILTLGIVGVVSEEKGINDFFRLSEYLRSHIENQKIELKIVGVHHYLPAEFPLIGFAANRAEKLDTQKFNAEIEKLDVVLFFYNSDMYKLTASGAIFDAINNKKRIICLSNDYFKSVIADSNIGIVCETVEEMSEVIENLLAGKRKFHTTSEDFENIQMSYNYHNIFLK